MQTPIFSHNLALTMIDVEGDLSAVPIILDEIKTLITESPHIHGITYKGFPFNAILYWKRVSLGPPFRNMMGDLFTTSLYSDDAIIQGHTKQMIYKIEGIMKQKYPNTTWSLVFHLTKIISECIPMTICFPANSPSSTRKNLQ